MMDNVIPLPPPSSFEDDERLRHVKAEAERLANQSEVERSFFLPSAPRRSACRTRL
jgi:hypothetical protein